MTLLWVAGVTDLLGVIIELGLVFVLIVVGKTVRVSSQMPFSRFRFSLPRLQNEINSASALLRSSSVMSSQECWRTSRSLLCSPARNQGLTPVPQVIRVWRTGSKTSDRGRTTIEPRPPCPGRKEGRLHLGCQLSLHNLVSQKSSQFVWGQPQSIHNRAGFIHRRTTKAGVFCFRPRCFDPAPRLVYQSRPQRRQLARRPGSGDDT